MKTNKSVTKKVASGAAGVALAATLYANAVYVPQNQEAARAELNAGVAAVLDGRADFVAKSDGYQVVERSAEIEKLVDEIASLQGEVEQMGSQQEGRAAYASASVVRTAQAGAGEVTYEEAIEGMSEQEAAAFAALTPAAKAQVATSANKSAALTTALQNPVNVVPAARRVFFNANNTPKPLATVSVAAIKQVAPAPVAVNTPVAVVSSTGSVAPVVDAGPVSAPKSGSPTGTTQGADIGRMASATANVFTSADDVANAETGTGASTALNAQSNVGGGNSGGNPSQEAASGESSNAATQIAVSGAADGVGKVAAAEPDTSNQPPTSP